METKIIAEAGVNHNGSCDLALELVDKAADAGADVVKFQTFKPSQLATPNANQAAYQIENIGKQETQVSMLSKLELKHEYHQIIAEHCMKRNITFLSTAFDSVSLSFLINNFEMQTLKIPSGELTNAPFVLEHARTNRNIILSTGMANLAEIETALGVLAFGFIAPVSENPTLEAFQEAYASEQGQQALKEKLTLLHCTTEYPAPVMDINLNAMNTMKNAFGVNVGYSDHSKGIAISIAAAAMGANIIEKHFTLDRNMEGPDHKASLEPSELTSMVSAIREIDFAKGNGIKTAQPSEIPNKPIARKVLVAAKAIQKNELFSDDNVTAKRAGTGIEPIHYWALMGKKSKYDLDENMIISPDNL